MNAFKVCFVLALAAFAYAELPSGYSYSRPSSPGGIGGGGWQAGGGGGGWQGSSGGGYSGGVAGGSGGYQAVPSGYQTSEGQQVDPQLLEQVRQILLKEEQQSGGAGGAGGWQAGGGGGWASGGGSPSSSYGAPAPQYGPPSNGGGRVVGIDLEGVKQAIQVAQFHQQSQQASGGYPSSSHGAPPSSSYGAPSW